MKNARQKIIFTGLQCKKYVHTRVDVQLLYILGLLIGPSKAGIFTKSLFFNFNSSALNRPNKIVTVPRSCKISAFNVSYSAVKSTAALIHHYHM